MCICEFMITVMTMVIIIINDNNNEQKRKDDDKEKKIEEDNKRIVQKIPLIRALGKNVSTHTHTTLETFGVLLLFSSFSKVCYDDCYQLTYYILKVFSSLSHSSLGATTIPIP